MDEIYAFLANSKDPEGRRLAECHLNRMKGIRERALDDAIAACFGVFMAHMSAAQDYGRRGLSFSAEVSNAKGLGAEECNQAIGKLKKPS